MRWQSILKNSVSDRILNKLGYTLVGKDDRASKLYVWSGVVYEKGEEIIALTDLFDFPPSNVILHDGKIMSWQFGEENVIVAGDNKEDIQKIFDELIRNAKKTKNVIWMGKKNTGYILDAGVWDDAQQEDSALGAEENYRFNRE